MTNTIFFFHYVSTILYVGICYIHFHVRIESRLARTGPGKGQDNWYKYDQNTTNNQKKMACQKSLSTMNTC